MGNDGIRQLERSPLPLYFSESGLKKKRNERIVFAEKNRQTHMSDNQYRFSH
jgi:hypothetical protein